jgi:site-specific DNA-cytosine methylase
VELPQNIGMLVAGFACVDFSALNSQRKSLSSGGESGDTFTSIFNYADRYRPKVLLFENIKNAPWTQIASLMSKIGYVALHLNLDTKSYYWPQTRNRGYMLCVDIENFWNHSRNTHLDTAEWSRWLTMHSISTEHAELQQVSDELMDRLVKWARFVGELEFPANVPAECFLLDDDDPQLQTIRSAELVTGGTAGRAVVAWDACQKQHEEYRQELNFGSKRPLTSWRSGGYFKVPDWFLTGSKGMGERLFDSLDVAHLRNLKRQGVDDCYHA